MNLINTDTVIALVTPQGTGALGVIRLSGDSAIDICDSVFGTKSLKKKELKKQASHTIHFGVIHDKDVIIDEVLVSQFAICAGILRSATASSIRPKSEFKECDSKAPFRPIGLIQKAKPARRCETAQETFSLLPGPVIGSRAIKIMPRLAVKRRSGASV